ncbi:MAG: GNAT family N-acetyltransferase, partial [Thermoplasmata archaeon]|nr:GNAT family N-acetyltransferase [Thermoplasmata archaeon]
ARRHGKRELRTGYDSPISIVWPGVDAKNRGARKFFAACGFEETSEEITMELDLGGYNKYSEIVSLRRDLSSLSIGVDGATRSDFEPLLRGMKGDLGWDEASYRELIVARKLRVKNIVLAKRSDRVVGFIRVRDDGGVLGIATDKNLRSRGIGKLLLFEAMRMLKRRGVELATLTTGAENFSAQRIYGKAGFTKTGSFFYLWKKIG